MGKIKNLTREIRIVIKHPVSTVEVAARPKPRMWEMADPLEMREAMQRAKEEKK